MGGLTQPNESTAGLSQPTLEPTLGSAPALMAGPTRPTPKPTPQTIPAPTDESNLVQIPTHLPTAPPINTGPMDEAVDNVYRTGPLVACVTAKICLLLWFLQS